VRKVGEFIDRDGVEFDLDDTDMVTDVVVILNVMGEDGRSWVCARAGTGTDVIVEEGLLSRAMKQLDERWRHASTQGGDD
jgi:hypothetical protein